MFAPSLNIDLEKLQETEDTTEIASKKKPADSESSKAKKESRRSKRRA